MITWKDFVIDDVLGTYLNFEECREEIAGGKSVMEDAHGSTIDPIQETGQELRPARMAGYTSLESVLSGKEADQTIADLSRPRGKG